MSEMAQPKKVRNQTMQNDHEVLGRMGEKAQKTHPKGSWRKCAACKERVVRNNWKVVP